MSTVVEVPLAAAWQAGLLFCVLFSFYNSGGWVLAGAGVLSMDMTVERKGVIEPRQRLENRLAKTTIGVAAATAGGEFNPWSIGCDRCGHRHVRCRG